MSEKSFCTHITKTTPLTMEQNTRQHRTVIEGSSPSLTNPLGILCIGGSFSDFRTELGTQVSYPYSVLFMTMSPMVMFVILGISSDQNF